MRKNYYIQKKIAKRLSIFVCLFLSMTSLSVIHIQAATQGNSIQTSIESQTNPILILSLSVISLVISYLILSSLKKKRSLNS